MRGRLFESLEWGREQVVMRSYIPLKKDIVALEIEDMQSPPEYRILRLAVPVGIFDLGRFETQGTIEFQECREKCEIQDLEVLTGGVHFCVVEITVSKAGVHQRLEHYSQAEVTKVAVDGEFGFAMY
jgi:hypothetical protein